jgi:hypothetical protein
MRQVIEDALRLDFFPPDAAPALSRHGRSRAYTLSERQRAARPYPHGGLTITAAAPEAMTSPIDGAGLSLGPFVPRRPWDGLPDEGRYNHLLIALTNAREGRETEFDDWYWNQHFPDGRRLPGCIAGRRYLLAEPGAGPFRHLAIYQFDIPDIGTVVEAHATRVGTPEMPLSDAISPVFQAWYVRPLGAWR